jgi:HEAT repeat protein
LLVEELRKVKSQKTSRRLRERRVKTILERTESAKVRNAAALALADMHAADADKALIGLLRRDDTRDSRGTLLYALEQIGARVPLDCLAHVLVHDGYEAREEALALLAEGMTKYDKHERLAAQRKLEQSLEAADKERYPAISKALEQLRNHAA